MRQILSILSATLQPFRSRRAAERIEVRWDARAVIGNRVHQIEVQNISTLGLMARVDVALLPGTTLTVHLPEQGALAGDVRWYREGRFGMSFDAPAMLNAAIVEKYRQAAEEQAEKLARWMV